MTDAPMIELGSLTVYWCPICKVQTERPWHTASRPQPLIPQYDVEHTCVKVAVEPIHWNLCCVCGVIAPDALWTYWHHNLDEATEEERPWVPARPGESDPMCKCPACGWEHRDTDDGSGYYTGTLASMQAQRENDEAEFGESWSDTRRRA